MPIIAVVEKSLTPRLVVCGQAPYEIGSHMYYVPADELFSMEKGGNIWYCIYDGHGSARLLTNEAGSY